MSAAHAAARGFAGAAVAAALLVACGSGEDVLVTPIEIQRVPSLLTVHSGTAGHRAIVSVENHLQKPLWIARYNLPSEGSMSKALFVVKRNGVDVPYRGWTAKRPAPSESDCFRLAPGEARTGSFQLDDAYEMSPLGTYEVRYETFNPQFPSASLVKVVSETVVLEVE